MSEILNITALIEAAEELVGNGMLDMAEEGSVPVQEIEIDGKVFKLFVVGKLKAGTG